MPDGAMGVNGPVFRGAGRAPENRRTGRRQPDGVEMGEKAGLRGAARRCRSGQFSENVSENAMTGSWS